MLELTFVIAATILVMFCIRWLFSTNSNIPEPPSWPLLGHSPYYLKSKDWLGLHEKWYKEFKEQGMYRIRDPILGFNAIFILRPEWMKYILTRPEEFGRRKILVQYFPLLGESLITATGEYHRFQRKILNKGFTTSYVKNYISVMDDHVQLFVKIWTKLLQENDKGNGTNIDVKKYTNNLTFDIICHVAFGYQANAQECEHNEFVSTLRAALDAFSSAKLRFIKKYFPFLQSLHRSFKNDSDRLLNELLEMRKQKILKNELTDFEKRDLLSVMVESVDEKTGKSFSDKLIKDTCFTFMLAGFETLSTALPITLYHFTQYPEMQERARNEIKEKFQDKNGELTYDAIDSLHFTNAFIKESLRKFPTLPTNSRITYKSHKFGDYVIPKDTFVNFHVHNANCDAEKFDLPNEFMPERYMPDSEMKVGTTLTFGYGPYNCIGKHFAMQEIRVVIIRLLQNFRFSMDPENAKFSRIPILAVRCDPPIQIRVRMLENTQI